MGVLLLLEGLYWNADGKKQIVKLQQSGEQLLYKERKLFQRLMAGLVISRCTKTADLILDCRVCLKPASNEAV